VNHLREQWRRAAGRYVFEVDWADNKDRLMGKNPDDPDNPYAKVAPEPVQGTSKMVIEADSELEAALIAETWVASTWGREPTGLRLLDWP
jgi:hypothetical protein